MAVCRSRWAVGLLVPGVLCVTLAARAGAQSGAAAAAPVRVTVRVTDAAAPAGRPVPDAVVRAGMMGARSDARGMVTLVLAPGRRTIVASKLGFRSDSATVALEPGRDTTISLVLLPQAAMVAPVVVTATRTEQRVEAVPLRVEVLAGEDIAEKNSVRPGDLTQMVAEIPGVRVQPVVPGLGGATLRVQGFKGEYTEFLTDGLPLGSAAEAAFSLVQQPPLDLSQVEVIKGASSALYGPSALGGVVNFITRRPPREGARPVRDALVAASSRGGLDGVAFLANRSSPSLGYTVLVGAHHDPLNDADRDAWADVARSSRAELRPRLYWHGANGSNLLATLGVAADDRRGGTVYGRTTPAGTVFLDQLASRHADAGVIGKWVLSPGTSIGGRASLTALRRSRTLGGVLERDRSHTALAEASLTRVRGSLIWVAGGAVRDDGYGNRDVAGFDYSHVTASVFAQLMAVASPALSASATARCDRHNVYGIVCAPLAAVLLRQQSGWSERLAGGLGSFAPTPLTDETQATGLARVRPFSGAGAPSYTFERARYAALDVGYRRGALDVNLTAHVSEILHPLLAHDLERGAYAVELLNAPVPTRTRGVDLFAVYTADPVSVTAFYSILRSREFSFDRAGAGLQVLQPVPLDPSRRAGLDVALDLDETGTRVAVETYYTGRQFVRDDPYRSTTPPYTTLELLATQTLGRVQLFASAENLTNVLQTRFDPLLLPARDRTGRWTTDIWAPIEGRTVRVGVRDSF